MSLHISATLQTMLSPRLQRAVRLLQMSSQDFAQAINDALDTNPLLEQEDAPAPSDASSSSGTAPRHCHRTPRTGGPDGVGRTGQCDGDAAVFDTLQARASLADQLLGQLKVMPWLEERPQGWDLSVSI